MKNTKFYGMLMLALLVVQSGVQAKQDDNKHPKKQRTWGEFGYENRRYIGLGVVAVGLGALGYVYGEDFMKWYNQQTPEVQAQAEKVIDKSIDQNLAEIEAKQEKIDEMLESKKLSPAQQKEVRKEEEFVAAKQKEVAQAQTWSQWINNVKDSWFNRPALEDAQYEEVERYRSTNPELIKLRADIAAQNAESADEDYQSSDMRTDSERAAYKRDFAMRNAQRGHDRDKARIERVISQKYGLNNLSTEDLNKAIAETDDLEGKLNTKYEKIQKDIDQDYPAPSEGYDLAKVGSDVASGLSSAYNSARNYFTGGSAPTSTQTNDITAVDVEGAQPASMNDID